MSKSQPRPPGALSLAGIGNTHIGCKYRKKDTFIDWGTAGRLHLKKVGRAEKESQ